VVIRGAARAGPGLGPQILTDPNFFRLDLIRKRYLAANGIFARVGRLASKEAMIQLLIQKCLLILLYALDVCNVNKDPCNHREYLNKKLFISITLPSSCISGLLPPL